MTTGKVTSISTDWRGDTLAASVSAPTSLLQVYSTVDFDEDGGWLVLADSVPLQYVSVDEDAATVQLATAVPATYEDGVPVVVWDPTVADGGAAVVEYVAQVELSNDAGTVEAILPHALIPTSGTDYLIGASVRLDDEDTPEVVEVLGRQPVLDRSGLRTALVSLTLPANQTIPNTTTVTVTGWGGTTGTIGGGYYRRVMPDVTVRGGADGVDIAVPGVYLIIATIDWANNSSGGRTSNMVITRGGTEIDTTQAAGAPAPGGRSTQQVSRLFVAQGNETVKMTVSQSSGGALDLRTVFTSLQVFQVAVG